MSRLTLGLLPLLVACGPSMSVDVLRPADIELPPHVQHIVVVDAAAPKNLGEEVLSGLEGVLTGEGLLADKEARLDAVDEVLGMLDESPRYTVVAGPDRIEETTIWDRGLSEDAVAELAARYDADAVLALEAFDSDSDVIDVTELLRAEDAGDVAEEIAWYVARRETEVLTSWRVYDTDGFALDQVREIRLGNLFDAEGESLETAIAGLPDGRSVVRGLALDAARDYGARIAPVWTTANRTLYTGSAGLDAGVDAARGGDLEAADKAFRTAMGSPDPSIAAKARMNAAVVAEARGDIGQALELAEAGARVLGTHGAYDYAAELRGFVRAHGEHLPR